jgi:phosphate transport system substrate-binding protein
MESLAGEHDVLFREVKTIPVRSRTEKPMHQLRVVTILSALAAAILPAAAIDISGAGATFPYPLYSKWADAYKKETGVGLNYQSIGSGGGIK